MNYIKMFESYNRIIEDSLKDYREVEDKHKKVMAKQIALTASAHIKYGDSPDKKGALKDWLEAFKEEPIVIDELNKLEF
jgi:hypothetical protein